MKLLLTIILFQIGVCSAQRVQLIRSTDTAITGSRKLSITRAAATFGTKITLSSVSPIAFGAFTFHLDTSSVTSAGVFKSDGTLLRTLWGNRRYSGGPHTETWDGQDDGGNEIPSGNYKIKVLSDTVNAVWEGVIGNTSDSLLGSGRHSHADGFWWDMCIAGNYGYFVNGYEEDVTASSTAKFSLTDIQKNINVLTLGISAQAVATDGTNVYWQGADPAQGNRSFVFATKVVDDTQVTFANGVPFVVTNGMDYTSVIDVEKSIPSGVAKTLGIAVQKTGNYLYTSHKTNNRIRILNKITGALLDSITVTAPEKIRIDNDSLLWVVSLSNVKKYSINSSTGALTLLLTISDVQRPFDAQVHNDTLAIIDGGSNQNIRYYTRMGTYISSFGQAGGYNTNSDAANDKFCFVNPKRYTVINNSDTVSYITYQTDGSFWVGDIGDLRQMHYSAGKTYLNQIQEMGFIYACAVDVNNPTRVFSNYLEFEVDYSKPLDNGINGSWKFKRNWSAGVIAANDNQYFRMRDVATLSNGRTYFLSLLNTSPYNNNYHAVEAVTGGTLRYSGVPLGNDNDFFKYVLNKDGSLITTAAPGLGQTGNWTVRPLAGFDGSNNPTYGTPYVIASVPAITGQDAVGHAGEGLFSSPFTSDSTLVIFNPSDANNPTGRGIGYHLGGVKKDKWKWQSSYVTSVDYMGDFPDDGRFDIGNNVQIPGGWASVVDSSIFTSYHGEFWKNSQTNYFNMFHQSGLMITQFGSNSLSIRDQYPNLTEGYPTNAGNALTGRAVKVGNNIYLYHSDEGKHQGVHRWKLSGINSIKIQTADIVKTGILSLAAPTYTDLLADLPKRDIVPLSVGNWTMNTPSNGITWTAVTGRTTYKKGDRDLYMKHRNASVSSESIQRDLGTIGSMANWNLTCDWSLEGNNVSHGTNGALGGAYWDVLDNTGKIIHRVITVEDTPYPMINIRVNSTNVVHDLRTSITGIINYYQAVELKKVGSTITFKYGPYQSTIPDVFEAGANASFPKTIRVTMFTNGANYDRVFDFKNLKFYNH